MLLRDFSESNSLFVAVVTSWVLASGSAWCLAPKLAPTRLSELARWTWVLDAALLVTKLAHSPTFTLVNALALGWPGLIYVGERQYMMVSSWCVTHTHLGTPGNFEQALAFVSNALIPREALLVVTRSQPNLMATVTTTVYCLISQWFELALFWRIWRSTLSGLKTDLVGAFLSVTLAVLLGYTQVSARGPWYVDPGYGADLHQVAKLLPVYNAFPSVHVVLAMLAAWFLRGSRWVLAGYVAILATVVATLATGEHYVLDLTFAINSVAGAYGLVHFKNSVHAKVALALGLGQLAALGCAPIVISWLVSSPWAAWPIVIVNNIMGIAALHLVHKHSVEQV